MHRKFEKYAWQSLFDILIILIFYYINHNNYYIILFIILIILSVIIIWIYLPFTDQKCYFADVHRIGKCQIIF